jgi:type 1 glutamine amidotransferase
MNRATFLKLMLSGLVGAPAMWRRAGAAETKSRKLVLIAGKPSHPPMMHEFRAGTILLEKRLQGMPGLVVERHEQGWVRDEATLDDAAAVVIFSDGGGGHPALQEQRLARLQREIARGMSFGCLHFAVEVPADRGSVEFRQWIGGHYEHQWSCNPIWEADFTGFPAHPVCRGVTPFRITDEWYFNMRFADGFDAAAARTLHDVTFTPLLVAQPSDATRDGPYVYPKGPYPHIQAAKGRPEAVMWSVERPDGGRGLGFTGGHFHANWQDDQFRKAILNSLVWLAGLDVPAAGIESAKVSDEELALNLDPKPPRK